VTSKPNTYVNKIFYIVAASAGTLAGAAVLLAASAVHRYRQRRAWKQVRGI
jgi:hypothetical protein